MSQAISWNSLFLTGSIIDTEATRWHARTKIKPADLGIEDSEEVAKALALGSHRLFPAEAFEEINQIVSQAKRAVEHHSLTFAMIRGARYVPSEQLDQLLVKLRNYRTAHRLAVDQFLRDYDRVKAEMLPVILQALRDAARDSLAVDGAYNRVLAEYPSLQDVRAKFSFRWSIYAVQSSTGSQAAEVAQEESENIKGVVRGMVEQLRTDVADKIAKVMAVIQKGGKLKESSISSAITCLDRVDALNVLGDESLRRQTQALRSALTSIDPNEEVALGTLNQLDTLHGELESGAEEAVRVAEQNLIGLGVRKLAVV